MSYVRDEDWVGRRVCVVDAVDADVHDVSGYLHAFGTLVSVDRELCEDGMLMVDFGRVVEAFWPEELAVVEAREGAREVG